MAKKRAVFLDRDGVLTLAIMRGEQPGGPRSLDEFSLVPGSRAAVRRLKREGLVVIVVTNQPDIARGLLSRKELEKMHALLRRELDVDDILVCPHDDADRCRCRKPLPGLLLEAADRWGIDLSRSFIIGDRAKDMMAGRAAGCATVLLEAPYNRRVSADYRASDLSEAVGIIRMTAGRKEER